MTGFVEIGIMIQARLEPYHFYHGRNGLDTPF